MEYDRAALKQEVKYDLQNTQPRATLVSLVYLLVTFALGLIVEIGRMPLDNMLSSLIMDIQLLTDELSGGAFNERALFRMVEEMQLGEAMKDVLAFGGMFSLISAIINWTMAYGYQGYCLSMVRRKNPGFTRLLCAFPKWGWVLLTGLLIGLFTALWTVLICILALVATVVLVIFVEGSWGITLAIVVWLAAAVWLVSVVLRYSMANYILLDERVDSLEAISRSKAMMRGRKWHLFVLELSFIGWALLAGLIGSIAGGIATLVVGLFSADPYAILSGMSGGAIVVTVVTELAMLPLLLWLQPYMVGSFAKFYNWMKHTDIAHGVWEGRYPKRRRPPEVKSDTIKIAPIADKEPESAEPPERPAYEENFAPERPGDETRSIPVVPAEEASETGPVEQPADPAEDVPDRPNYE